jgi:hypothetical protein
VIEPYRRFRYNFHYWLKNFKYNEKDGTFHFMGQPQHVATLEKPLVDSRFQNCLGGSNSLQEQSICKGLKIETGSKSPSPQKGAPEERQQASQMSKVIPVNVVTQGAACNIGGQQL